MARSRTGTSKDRGREGSSGGLKIGLFAGVQDREELCIVDGCTGTWTYSGQAQMENLGRTPPAGHCPRHLAERTKVQDRELECRVEGCQRTRVWSSKRQMQAMYPGGLTPGATPRKVRPPAVMCEPCDQKYRSLKPQSGPCKVHGCSREAEVDRESLLRSWAALATDDLDAPVANPRRMCDVCRDYCRTHKDREVPCVRAGCSNTWTLKTGAQLQAFLAGKVERPARPCAAHERDEEQGGTVESVDGSSEVLPCVVRGCAGTWTLAPGERTAAASEGSFPRDRMCSAHRSAGRP